MPVKKAASKKQETHNQHRTVIRQNWLNSKLKLVSYHSSTKSTAESHSVKDTFLHCSRPVSVYRITAGDVPTPSRPSGDCSGGFNASSTTGNTLQTPEIMQKTGIPSYQRSFKCRRFALGRIGAQKGIDTGFQVTKKKHRGCTKQLGAKHFFFKSRIGNFINQRHATSDLEVYECSISPLFADY